MDKRFDNKMTMLKTIFSFLKQNAATWNNSPALVAAYYELESLISQIEQIQKSTGEDNSGLTEAKKLQIEALIIKVYEWASVLVALASKIEDSVLKAKVDFPISDLRDMRNSELAKTSENVLDLCRSNLTALTEYGATEEKLNKLEVQIEQYKSILPARRLSVTDRKAANEKLKVLLKHSLMLVADQIDRMMFPFASDKPEFYASYLNARKVVPYGTRYEKPEDPKKPE
jgi:hypothetical protein